MAVLHKMLNIQSIASSVTKIRSRPATLAQLSTCTQLHRPFLSAGIQKPFYAQRSRAAAVEVEHADAEQQTAGYAAFALDSHMAWPARSHGAGSLSADDAGKEVTVCGWVDRNRNLGGLGFMDIRDHTGLLQVSPAESVQLQVHTPFWHTAQVLPTYSCHSACR
jgi:lysyl-tRNA synthetase class II